MSDDPKDPSPQTGPPMAFWSTRGKKIRAVPRRDAGIVVGEGDRSSETATVPNKGSLKTDFWTAADRAMLGLCELLALLFGLPFGEDLYNDKPVTGLHLFYLAIGILFAVAGPMWPWIRTRSWISEYLVVLLSRTAVDSRAWLAVLLVLFLYGIGPELYRRATAPSAPAPTSVVQAPAKPLIEPGQSVISGLQLSAEIKDLRAQVGDLKRQNDALRDAQKNFLAIGAAPQPPPPTDLGPVVWTLESQFLVYTGGGPEATINSVLLQGTSTRVVSIKEAYAVSGLTGHKQELMANVQYRGHFPVDKVDIPPQAPVWLELIWKPPLSIRDFLDQWGNFHVTVIYDDGAIFDHDFDENYIRRKLQQIPGAFGPRVTPRNEK